MTVVTSKTVFSGPAMRIRALKSKAALEIGAVDQEFSDPLYVFVAMHVTEVGQVHRVFGRLLRMARNPDRAEPDVAPAVFLLPLFRKLPLRRTATGPPPAEDHTFEFPGLIDFKARRGRRRGVGRRHALAIGNEFETVKRTHETAVSHQRTISSPSQVLWMIFFLRRSSRLATKYQPSGKGGRADPSVDSNGVARMSPGLLRDVAAALRAPLVAQPDRATVPELRFFQKLKTIPLVGMFVPSGKLSWNNSLEVPFAHATGAGMSVRSRRLAWRCRLATMRSRRSSSQAAKLRSTYSSPRVSMA